MRDQIEFKLVFRRFTRFMGRRRHCTSLRLSRIFQLILSVVGTRPDFDDFLDSPLQMIQLREDLILAAVDFVDIDVVAPTE